MNLKSLAKNWDAWGEQDAMYAVLTDPAKRHNGWDHDEFFATGLAEITAVMDYLRGLGVDPGRGTALDFGCGVGRLTQALAESFDAVIGLDIAPSMIAGAERFNRFVGRCRYAVNAVDDLSQLQTGTVDFVYCNIVLQHMRPAYAHAYVREFFRVLRPGGVAVFFLPEAPQTTTRRTPPGRRAVEVVRTLLNAASTVVRGRPAFPRIDMFGTPRATVERLVASSGGTAIDVTADASAGDGWTGFRYCCRRTP